MGDCQDVYLRFSFDRRLKVKFLVSQVITDAGPVAAGAGERRLVKIGAKVIQHAKYVTFQLAEVAITRKLFTAILDHIERLALPPAMIAQCSVWKLGMPKY